MSEKNLKGEEKMNNNTMYKALGAGVLAGTAALAMTNAMSKNATKKKMKKTAKKAVNTFSDVVENMNSMMK